jgi:hypothetical protein
MPCHFPPSCRPLVFEEFGISRRFEFVGEEEQKVVVAVVADALVAAKRAGRNLMGAMLWSATLPSECGLWLRQRQRCLLLIY